MNNTALVSYWVVFTRTRRTDTRSPTGLPKFINAQNAGAKCDMATGPCSCGSWHYLGEKRS